ncbi:putative membrane protein YgcG [Chryseobacterium ginsenosidimutans]|uniref:DUF2207 domain-containing protein n=1 Tax=Chryseobacterium ginsenosidimutans TaxID=687846 RepID=UPI0021676D85|nr:DUF2207 domain-containing protein [Chryseobacterium ginsenosidimutans]MCS3871241.1 putative membrane protein YgcG [Chryseobacterium ginsenosidimutans]
MKKYLLLFYLLIFALGFSQESSDSSYTVNNSERILSFHSDIDVNKNSGITVTEKIKVHSLGNEIKRGIYRALPLTRNLNKKKQRVKYDIISIKKDGAEENYHTKINGDFLEIYLGNKDVILDPGDYNYEIKYETENQIGFFDKYDELYWNVNGTYWNFTVDSISATVNLPAGADIIQNSCYTGESGSSEKNCSSKVLSENSIEWSASNLQPNENLTIAVGFKKGIMIPPPPPTFMEKFGILIIGSLLFFGLLIYYYRTWRKYGIDPESPVVYPQFNVPDNLSPASLGYLKKEGFKNNQVTAALVNLAVKGYVKIIEGENDGILGFFSSKIFSVQKLKEPDQLLPKEEINLMNNLFGSSDSVKFDGKYNEKIKNAVTSFRSALEFQHDTFLNEGNNRNKLLLPFFLMTIIYAIGLIMSYKIYPEPGKLVIGGFLYIILLVAFIIFTFVIKKLSWLFIPFPIIVFMGLSGMITIGHDVTEDNNFSICYIFIALAFMSLIIYQFLIKKPSEEKLRKKSLIDGFKMYMGAAENEQIKFHNPPQMTPQVFETLLPFAMVLGVDAIWGEKFEQIMKNMAMEYTNNWYYGSSLNQLAFASALNSSLTNSIQTSSTQPSSSSSGSGSGGGGFSGGGGGGGGGGGW